MRKIILVKIFLFYSLISISQKSVSINNKEFNLYPFEYIEQLDIKSPLEINGREYILAKTDSNKYSLIDVTVENGKPFNYKGKVRGKGNQLYVNGSDFPTLEIKGLHSEKELKDTRSITGKSIAEITMRARPMRMSGAGFIAEDEDIISVIMGDNELVKKMKLTHPELAKTIFHYWNIIQVSEAISQEQNITTPSIDTIFYNNRVIKYNAPGCRGWQYSIFEDSIWGECHLEIQVELSETEELFINENCKHLTSEQITDFIKRLTHMHTGEMAAYYIQMYGFYEGHTDYRADPIVLAYIFGLKSLNELFKAFDGKVYENIINHHVSKF